MLAPSPSGTHPPRMSGSSRLATILLLVMFAGSVAVWNILFSHGPPDEPRGDAHRKRAHGEVWWIQFSPDSRHLVSGGDDAVKVWTVDGTLQGMVRGGSNYRYPDGAFSPDSHAYVVASSRALHEVTLAPPYATRSVEVARDQNRWTVPVVAFRDGVAIESRGNAFAFVPLDAPKRALVLPVPEGRQGFVIASKNHLVLTDNMIGGEHNRPENIWLYDRGQPQAPPYLLDKGRVSDPLVSPDGRYLTVNLDKKLTLFDLDKREKRWALGGRDFFSPTGFTPGNRWLFANRGKGLQISLDVETGRERGREYKTGLPSMDLDALKDLSRGALFRAVAGPREILVVAREGDRIELLDLDLRHLAFLGFRHQYGWDASPTALETSPDGRWAAIGYRGRLHLWDLDTRKPTYLVDPQLKDY